MNNKCEVCDGSGDCQWCPNRYDGCDACDGSGNCQACAAGAFEWPAWPEGEALEPGEVVVAEGSPLQGLLADRDTKGKR